MSRLANRIQSLPPYLFADVDRRIAEKRAQGVDVISLGIGDPDLPTPPAIVEALCATAHDSPNHRYPDNYGLPALKAAISKWYQERFVISVDAQKEVLPLIGSKEGIAHVAWALLDPGDIALVPSPGYPVYQIGTMLANAKAYLMPLEEQNGFLPDLGAIPEDVASQAKLIWINYPNNPTSATAPASFYHEVVAFARQHNLVVCHDAAYTEVAFDGYRPLSFLEIPGAREVGIEFHSFSKTYNMTGWRIGMAVGNEELIEGLGRLKTNIDSGIFNAVQYAAIEALTTPQSWIDERNLVYQRRRDLVLKTLEQMGIRAQTPRGGLYIWAAVPGGVPSVEYSLKLLDQTGVFVTPGVGFGTHGEGYFRISLTTPDERLDEAMRRSTSA
jgi:LL-diaminopimelate aminotransferase